MTWVETVVSALFGDRKIKYWLQVFHFSAISVVLVSLTVDCSLLRGHLIGRITRLARPSVCLSVCPVMARKSNTKKERRKIKIGRDIPQGTSKWMFILTDGHQAPAAQAPTAN